MFWYYTKKMKQRTLAQITTPHAHEGFLGEGHIAAAVIDGTHFSQSDPFMLLMDDRIDLPGGPPVGGAHPHAGFETVTLVLQGNEKEWKTGSLELMTAGKGIVHTEEITSKTSLHILQLWLVLPPEKRWTYQSLQQLLLEDVPTLKTDTSEVRVYSGSSNGLQSPLKNHTPFTLVDFAMKEKAESKQHLPASYNGFIYVLQGSVWVGEKKVRQGQTAWFDKSTPGESEIILNTHEEGARFVLYAAQPHGVPVVSHGPFIGDSQEDIVRLYQEYRQGKMPHVNDLPASSNVRHTVESTR